MAKPKIVVIGGGFGGLESLFYLKSKLKDKANFTLISDKEYFLFKPNTIYIPFGLSPEKLKIELSGPTKRKGIEFIHSKVIDIDPSNKKVILENDKISYDYLVISTGASMREEEIEGLKENAHTIWKVEDMLKLREGINNLIENLKKGEKQRVIFMIPPNNKCSGPLYEIVFMLDTFLRNRKLREKAEIIWTTFEKNFIQAFGFKIHKVVKEEFEKRGIKSYTEFVVERIDKKQIIFKNGEKFPFDLLISFPPYIASSRFEALPVDDRGFIYTDLKSMRVKGLEDIYSVGDIANFPVKQAFLAFLQADAAAEHLKSVILDQEPEFYFESVSMCIMEQFDKATFAQVPVKISSNPDIPVEIDEEKNGLYRVGSGKIWRLGKKMLGMYLPLRFKYGNPFHAGIPWKIMEKGVEIMSKIFASL